MQTTAIILAAGLGTRMRSSQPKAMQKLAGRPMLRHLIAACETVFDRIVVVIGPDMEALAQQAAPHAVVVQQDRLGTAHAASQAAAAFGDGLVAVLYADNPLITAPTMQRLLSRVLAGDAALALLAMRPADPGKYGRVIEEGGYVARIVEFAEAGEAERAVGLCNAGVVCAPAADMRRWLGAVKNDNAKGEYYLGDVIPLAAAEGARTAAVAALESELLGVNSRAELAIAEAEVQKSMRLAALAVGVGMTAPETVFLSWDTVLEPDCLIGPHVVFGPGVRVEGGAEIRAFSHLEGCVVKNGAVVGPYARLRPGTLVDVGAHVGNFVELKAAHLGPAAKANHLSYLGDAEIGPRANIGAGTITCNYDGTHKHRTVIGADSFVGSDTALVAPVTIGAGVLIAAGSVVTDDVPDDALVIARARQEIKPGRGARSKRRH